MATAQQPHNGRPYTIEYVRKTESVVQLETNREPVQFVCHIHFSFHSDLFREMNSDTTSRSNSQNVTKYFRHRIIAH